MVRVCSGGRAGRPPSARAEVQPPPHAGQRQSARARPPRPARDDVSGRHRPHRTGRHRHPRRRHKARRPHLQPRRGAAVGRLPQEERHLRSGPQERYPRVGEFIQSRTMTRIDLFWKFSAKIKAPIGRLLSSQLCRLPGLIHNACQHFDATKCKQALTS